MINKCIAWAVQLTTDSFVAMLEGIDDPYLKARANDLKDVSERVLRILLGIEKVSLDHLPQGTILITDDLKPSDSVGLKPELIEGIITSEGSETSHSAIIARTLGIPAVMGVETVLTKIAEGDLVIIDGESGEIHVNPDDTVVSRYESLKLKRRNL